MELSALPTVKREFKFKLSSAIGYKETLPGLLFNTILIGFNGFGPSNLKPMAGIGFSEITITGVWYI
jgi:hypothetical protein